MRIMILTFDNIYSGIVLDKLFKTFKDEISCIVLSDCIIPGKSRLRSIVDIVKKSNLFFLWFKLLETLSYTFILKKKMNLEGVEVFTKEGTIPILYSKNVNDLDFVAKIKEINPDIILSINFNQIIRGDVLKIPSFGCINIHSGLLPKYRGMFPYYWALANGEKTAGMTIHYIDEGLDTGDIIKQKKVVIDEDDSVFSLNCKLYMIGADLLIETLSEIKSGHVTRIKQVGESSYYSWPTFESYSCLKKHNKKLIGLKDIKGECNYSAIHKRYR